MDIVDYCKKKNSIFTGDNSGTGYTFSDKLLKMRETDYNVGLNQKKIVLEKYENELKRYRSEAFLEDSYEGIRKCNKEIMTILKRGVVIDSYTLLEELGIDPKETDLVKAVSKQLEDLESYGLISSTQRGWRWVG